MALSYTHLLVLLIATASMFEVGMANKNFTMGSESWNFRFNYTGWRFRHPNAMHEVKKITIGGFENWHFEYNYSNWYMNNRPSFYSDTLVFKYEAVFKYDLPSSNNTHPHSVYLLSNLRSFIRYDLRRAKRVAGSSEGGGNEFEFVLNKRKPHFLACGESNGFHYRFGIGSAGLTEEFLGACVFRR